MFYDSYYDWTRTDGTTYREYIRHGCGIDTHYKEIPKAEFDRLSAMTYAEVNAEIIEGLSDSIKYGYGYYGHELFEYEGKYYLGKKFGNSCD